MLLEGRRKRIEERALREGPEQAKEQAAQIDGTVKTEASRSKFLM